jgi:hypothetical protein
MKAIENECLRKSCGSCANKFFLDTIIIVFVHAICRKRRLSKLLLFADNENVGFATTLMIQMFYRLLRDLKIN